MKKLTFFFTIAATVLLMLWISAFPVFADDSVLYNVSASVSLTTAGSAEITVEGTAPVTGTAKSLAGKTVTLTAKPQKGYVFDRWEILSGTLDLGDYSKETVSFSMPGEDVNIKAHFKVTPTYTVEIAADTIYGEGYIPSAKNIYQKGESVTVEAHPYDGFRFVGWKEDASTLTLTEQERTNPKLTFTMPGEDVVLTMEFEPITYYFTVKIQGNGTVEVENKEKNSAGKYECHVGEEIVIRAAAAEEYVFVTWTGLNGPEFSDHNQDETTLTCPASDFTVVANFASSVKNLTLVAGEGGNVEPEAGTIRFGVENILDLTALPNAGFVFSHWECTSPKGKFENEKAESTTFTMPDEDCTVTAIFVKGGYKLTSASSAGGKAEMAEGVYEMGTKIKIKATALEGYVFSRWDSTVSDVIASPESPETEVTIPGRDVKITAVFVLKATLGNSGETPVDPTPESGFPWLALVVIFLISSVAIALVIVRERYDLSYGKIIKEFFLRLFHKK